MYVFPTYRVFVSNIDDTKNQFFAAVKLDNLKNKQAREKKKKERKSSL